MNELPISISQSVKRYKPIEIDGLTLYPVLVREYDNFLIARPALEVMQQSFPVALMRVPLLSALYQMDFEALSHGKQSSGLFSRALMALALSLRLGEGQTIENRVKMFRVTVDRENPEKLLALHYADEQGNVHAITPAQYKTLRVIIAAQNGVRLESDQANPDLVQAQKDLAAANSCPLEASTDDLISAISALAGVSEEEIDEWPILKLDRRAETYRRMMDYIICGIGETNGASWKGGNPAPHPFFKKISGNPLLKEIGTANTGKSPAPPDAARELRDITKNLSR